VSSGRRRKVLHETGRGKRRGVQKNSKRSGNEFDLSTQKWKKAQLNRRLERGIQQLIQYSPRGRKEQRGSLNKGTKLVNTKKTISLNERAKEGAPLGGIFNKKEKGKWGTISPTEEGRKRDTKCRTKSREASLGKNHHKRTKNVLGLLF